MTIAAVLRGYDLPGLTEDNMPHIRMLISRLILSLPNP